MNRKTAGILGALAVSSAAFCAEAEVVYWMSDRR